MGNDFVSYLNSMNNAGSDTAAALAEMQVKSDYYDKIKIQRKLGTYIVDSIRNGEHIAYVLTGHAGDGKTSILVQVLQELDMLGKGEAIPEEKLFTNESGIKLYAVKDMSELEASKQSAYFRKALIMPNENGSSILISNTGPLIKCFEEMAKQDHSDNGTEMSESDIIELQNNLLNQLDNNDPQVKEIGGYKVMVINIARIDNVDFAEKVLHKILSEDLWSPCEACEKKERCPIYNNVSLVRKYEEKVAVFITSTYRYLYENDKRMTIRQMLSQISYSITGNRKCGVIRGDSQEQKFKYFFSNLFFGYNGIKLDDNALQIQGISYLNELLFDSKTLHIDYALFVSGLLHEQLNDDIYQLVENKYRRYLRHCVFNSYDDCAPSDNDVMLRKAIRRMYIIFHNDDSENGQLLDEIFGKGFNDFMQLTGNSSRSVSCKNDLVKIIRNALYIEATGNNPADSNMLPVTVKRNDNMYQEVMVLDGQIALQSIKLNQTAVSSVFEESGKQDLYLDISGNKFKLTLPLVIYFEQIADGCISTNSNPSLTHGISKLKAILRETAKTNGSQDSFYIMLNKTDGPKPFTLQIEDNMLYIE